MERLTKQEYINNPATIKTENLPSYTSAYWKLAEYESTGLTPDDCMEYKKFEDELVKSNKTFKHILELLKAEEQGLLQNTSCNGCNTEDCYECIRCDKYEDHYVALKGGTP